MSKPILYLTCLFIVIWLMLFHPLYSKDEVINPVNQDVIITMDRCTSIYGYGKGSCYKLIRYLTRIDYIETMKETRSKCDELNSLLLSFQDLPVPDEKSTREYDLVYYDLTVRTRTLKTYFTSSCKS